MEKKDEPMDGAPKKGLLSQVDKKKIMEHAFSLLKKQGKNTVEGLFKYLKERKLLDDNTEKIAKHVLSGVADPKNIDYNKFAEVCGSVAKEKGLDMENISKNAAAALFGNGSAAKSGGSGAPADGAASTSVQMDDDHHEPSEDHYDSADDYHDSADDHHETDDDHHETDDHHESDDHHDLENDHH